MASQSLSRRQEKTECFDSRTGGSGASVLINTYDALYGSQSLITDYTVPPEPVLDILPRRRRCRRPMQAWPIQTRSIIIEL